MVNFTHIIKKKSFLRFLPLAAVTFFVALQTNKQDPAPISQQPKNIKITGYKMDDTFTLITTREIQAPLKKVWEAWRDPKKIAKWWGPAGFHSTVKELNIRPGGCFEIIMHGPDGTEYPNLYIFDHVEEYKQLVYTNTGSEKFGLAPFQSVFDLESVGNKTRVVLKARFISEEDKRKHVEEFHAIEGSKQLLQRLEEQAK
ncbi:MAG: SRPBCC domain-containing protein [Bacteroidota bacterium]